MFEDSETRTAETDDASIYVRRLAPVRRSSLHGYPQTGAAVAEYHAASRRDRMLRAALTHDAAHDRSSRAAGDRVDPPVPALWSAAGRTADADPAARRVPLLNPGCF